jgi:hypothetical protein
MSLNAIFIFSFFTLLECISEGCNNPYPRIGVGVGPSHLRSYQEASGTQMIKGVPDTILNPPGRGTQLGA